MDTGGSRLTIDNAATVAPVPIVVTGSLNPTSDSGKSDTDDITNVTQPNFIGYVSAVLRHHLSETSARRWSCR